MMAVRLIINDGIDGNIMVWMTMSWCGDDDADISFGENDCGVLNVTE